MSVRNHGEINQRGFLESKIQFKTQKSAILKNGEKLIFNVVSQFNDT